MWRIRKVEKVAKCARNIMSLEQKLAVLDRHVVNLVLL
jgi:hypothetical protein